MCKSTIKKFAILLVGVVLFGAAQAAETSDTAKKPPAPTKEQREQMAKLHEQMATCLRSEKTIGECREAMRAQCQQAMGEHCAMMGPMGPEHHMNMHREDGAPPAKPQQ